MLGQVSGALEAKVKVHTNSYHLLDDLMLLPVSCPDISHREIKNNQSCVVCEHNPVQTRVILLAKHKNITFFPKSPPRLWLEGISELGVEILKNVVVVGFLGSLAMF